MNWNYLIIVICILLAVYAGWKEYVRQSKSRLVFRIIAVVVAVVSLACLALPITYQTNVQKTGKNEVVLVTKGFNIDSLRHYNGQKLFVLDQKMHEKVPKATFLHHLNALFADSNITQLRILGDGLDREDLEQLNHLPVIFYPQKIKDGITVISWNEKIKTGDELHIQGRFKNASSKKVKLVLKGLSTNLDSAIVGPATIAEFHLTTIPKNQGKYVYSLMVMNGADTLANEPFPVQIEPVKPLKVLMLTASPDFESRFLKNWLSAKGYAVAIRSAISKDKYNKEFINLEQFPLDHISALVLSKFDILIGDLAVLKSLNGQEAAALQQEAAQKGLGIIVQSDSTLRSTSWLQRDFPSDRLAVKNPAPVSLILQGKTGSHAKLKVGSVYIGHQNGTQPLVSDEHGHLLVSSTLVGAGKIVFTPLNNTFSWMLGGNEHDYSALWSLLISKAARKVPVTESWNVLSDLPSVSNPVQLQLESAVVPSVIKIESAITSPQQNNRIPFEWKTTYWPHGTGWQTVKQNNGVPSSWYVYKNDDWESIHTLKKQADTKAYIAKNAIVDNVTKQIHEKVTIAVSKVYFYGLLLIACVFLWVEAKFLQK
jgi:hypothetical protein